MSTKPTRQQVRGGELLSQALLLIAESARLDGKAATDRAAWSDLAAKVGRVSTAISFDEILSGALESRGKGLGLRSGTAELLTLVEGEVPPLMSLLLGDEEFRALVEAAEAELGEV